MKTRALLLALPLVALGLGGCHDNRASNPNRGNLLGHRRLHVRRDLRHPGAREVHHRHGDDEESSSSRSRWRTSSPNNANLQIGKVNTNDAHIDEAFIEYQGAYTGRAVLGMNAVVFAGGTSVIFVEIVPQAVGIALGAQATPRVLLANLKLRGYYDDGSASRPASSPSPSTSAPRAVPRPVAPASTAPAPASTPSRAWIRRKPGRRRRRPGRPC